MERKVWPKKDIVIKIYYHTIMWGPLLKKLKIEKIGIIYSFWLRTIVEVIR